MSVGPLLYLLYERQDYTDRQTSAHPSDHVDDRNVYEILNASLFDVVLGSLSSRLEEWNGIGIVIVM